MSKPWTPRPSTAVLHLQLLADLADLARSTAPAAPPRHHGPIQIPHAPGLWYQETLAVYDYAQDAIRCPICGGVGMPWRGWFRCDGSCHALAVVADGRTFLPITMAMQPQRAL